jgi:hypothetical protein
MAQVDASSTGGGLGDRQGRDQAARAVLDRLQ